MNNKRWVMAVVLAVALIVWGGDSQGKTKKAEEKQRQIRIVGSSTVYPFVTAAAEMFGLNGRFKTPIVESTGTGGGFKIFCSGTGIDTPDINNASRAILSSEVELCGQNDVKRITEIPLGYDGITLSSSVELPRMELTIEQIFLAMARQVPAEGRLVDNPYTHWKQIDPALPDIPIHIYGPPPTSGTRDAFLEMVMEKGCEKFPAFHGAYEDGKARALACKMLREDGVFIEAGENGNLVIQKLQTNPGALGMVGYSFLEENADKVQASAINGVIPNTQSIAAGAYPLARKLYVYVKDAHVGQVPGLAEFLEELTSDAALGPDGYLAARGLLPLPAAEKKAMQAVIAPLIAQKDAK